MLSGRITWTSHANGIALRYSAWWLAKAQNNALSVADVTTRRRAIFVEASFPDAILRGLILAAVALFWMVLLIRLNGLQTLSKMTNIDFVATIAFGSLIAGASQATEWTGFVQALAANAGLLGLQAIILTVRKHSKTVSTALGNEPCLIMRNGEFQRDAMMANGVRREDVIAKLREANVLQLSEVRAAILETTGDVSVLHGEAELDKILLEDVRGT